MPEVIEGIAALRERIRNARRAGLSIGFVPTMGALHAGHEKLLETARRETGFVVASIFVNPLQFDRSEDLERYPRTLEQDVRRCEQSGVDAVFAPAASELYPRELLTIVELPRLSESLCGRFRPGHFRGVATVVLKLLQVVQPDRAYFGRKDAQQLVLIERMVKDLDVPVEIVPVATVREPDGLALSSRNKHLTPAQRTIAPILSRALRATAARLDAGERSSAVLRDQALGFFEGQPEVRLEYFELVDPDTLAPVEKVDGPVLIAGAMWVGSTRLIDNVFWPETT